MSASAILVASNRQLTGKIRVLLLAVVVAGAAVAAGALITVYDNPYAMRRYATGVFCAVIGGLAVFFAGVYGMLKRRHVRFEPARAVVADVRSFLGDETLERTSVRALERVSLEIVRGKRGQVAYYNAVLRGPRDLAIDLGDFFERGQAVAAGTRAAAITGLPLDEQREDGALVRLRAEQLSALSDVAAEEDEPSGRWLTAIVLLLANLLPLAGVLWWGWKVQSLMVLFWAENVIIGVYAALRLASSPERGSWGGALFFLLHYGLFCTVHGVFVFAIFFRFGRGQLHPSFWWVVAALAVSHGVAFYRHYLRSRKYDDDAGALVLVSYGRMIALHLGLVVGGGLVVALGQPIVPLLMMVAMKIVIDLGGHITEGSTPRIAPYVELAEAQGEVVVPGPAASPAAAPQAELPTPAVNPDARPLSHYLGAWRLAPSESAPAGWFAGIQFRNNGGKLGVHLTSQPGGAAGEAFEGAAVRGEAQAIEWIEVRLKSPGRSRVLRFAPSQVAGAGGLELSEVQQPEGNARAAQMRSFSLVRA